MVTHSDGARRLLDNESARAVKEEAREWRKRAAFRVIDSGGSLLEAQAVSGADRRTVKRWLAEREVK